MDQYHVSTDRKPPSEKEQEIEQVHIEKIATQKDAISHEEPVWKEFLRNPKVILLCLFANVGAFMYGYDNLSLSLCLSMPPFQAEFGTLVNGQYLIAAYWQSLWNAVAQIGTMTGAGIAGTFQDRFGRRYSFIIGAIISVIGVAVVYISTSPGVFLAGKTINGIALGMCLTTGQTYVSEISPLRIRGMMLGVYTIALNLGTLIAASVAFSRISIMTQSAYKVMFALEWIWPGLIIIFGLLIPESPYFLVRAGKNGDAGRLLKRILPASTDTTVELDHIVSLKGREDILYAMAKKTGFWDCFKGTNWRRTRIIVYCNALPQMIGTAFLTNGPYFMIQAGMTPSNASMIIEIGIVACKEFEYSLEDADLGLRNPSIGVASGILTLWLIGFVGRRKIVLSGVSIATLLFMVMGIAGCFPHSPKALWAVGICLQLVWCTLGPAVGPSMAISGEISEVRLRAKSQAIGFAFNYFWSTVWNVVIPYMFNSDQGNLGGYMGWIFFATSLISLVVIFFEFPETKDIPYEVMDEMFELKVPARKFKEFGVEDVTN
ncbi:general substrate transporter [Glonium stellatum]|uniref:General substrate transporter n=1 Tax=Glonium stellatum TaxID=574774 RepID=A0A8E2EYU5_9PEZI|nr:general substrate transporter [Glonium stellatum]